MENLILNAEVRTKEETTKNLKTLKKLAGVVYGNNQEAISLKMDYSDFLKVFRKSGMSNIIILKFGKENIEVLVHQIQQNPITGDYTHIDFYAITRGQVLITNIHLNFVGNSETTKEGAILEEQLKEIEVKCLPKNLVNSFDVDLSLIKKIGDSIRVSDLNIDLEKFELLTNPDDLIVMANKPKSTNESDEEEISEIETEENTKIEEK